LIDAVKIQPLDGSCDRTDFSSGAPELDRYLREQATQDMRRRIAAVFVALDAGPVIGYYTLSSSAIELTELPEQAARRLPRHPFVPATLLGRLAVDVGWQGRHLGGHLLLDALLRSFRSEIASYAVVVDARDERAEGFYEHYGFARLGRTGRRMFLPMAMVARLG
jgi:predicted GNAT family N-acyltransferase